MTIHYNFHAECGECQYVLKWHDETCCACAYYGEDDDCRATAACYILH